MAPTPEEKAEILAVLFNDALGRLAGSYAVAEKLDELVEGFKRGDVVLEFSMHGLTVKVATPSPPASPN
jgi:hypothetical protein